MQFYSKYSQLAKMSSLGLDDVPGGPLYGNVIKEPKVVERLPSFLPLSQLSRLDSN